MVVEQTKCLKSWICEVIKSEGFTLINVAVQVLNIKKGVNWAQEDNLGNNKAADEAVDEAADEAVNDELEDI